MHSIAETRKRLGLSLSELTDLVGFNGDRNKAIDRMREMENGLREVSPAVSLALRYLECAGPDQPKWLLAESASAEGRRIFLEHGQFPRFRAELVPGEDTPAAIPFNRTRMSNGTDLVFSAWIDPVIEQKSSHERLWHEAIEYLQTHANDWL